MDEKHTTPEGLNPDGTLKPPAGHEQTDIKAEGLANPQEQPQQMTTKILTLDEADILRAIRGYSFHQQTEENLNIRRMFNEIALEVAKTIISHCPAGKERSQALGSLNQVVLWCQASLDMSEATKYEANNQ